MLIGNPGPIAPPNRIDLSDQAPLLAADFKGTHLGCLIIERETLVVEPPTGVDSCVRNTNLFDLFQVEETFAVQESVQ
jgi:hypothetical protein